MNGVPDEDEMLRGQAEPRAVREAPWPLVTATLPWFYPSADAFAISVATVDVALAIVAIDVAVVDIYVDTVAVSVVNSVVELNTISD